MKFTSIEMEWTDTGAVVKSSMQIGCPRCHATVPPNSEHRCGDRMAPSKKKSATNRAAQRRKT
jgi:hypothetical protein